MITERDKLAILNGAYGITRDGNKCRYVGLSTDDEYPYVFVKYNSYDKIIDVKNLCKDLVYYRGETHPIDVVGLWEEEPQLTWLDRVKLELESLDQKRTKLVDMLAKGQPEHISPEEWERLNKQAEAMSAYAFILQERIVANTKQWENFMKLVSYSEALTAVKLGKKIAREGWNGKGMFVLLIKGVAVSSAIQERYGSSTEPLTVNDFTMLRGVDGKLSTWVPSSTDQLAEDWVVLD